MSDDMDVGTDKVQETIEEKRREALEERERAERSRPRWLDYLAISTALFAVLAAIAALEAGDHANEALFKANQAVLQQTRAVDTWSEYQANAIRRYQQMSLATLLKHTGGTPGEINAALTDATKRQRKQTALQATARQLDRQTEDLNRDSERQLEHHHRFAIAVTMLQVAIGLSAIAALLRMPVVWYVSLAAGAFSLLVLIDGFTLTV